jgi:hypothetical protein
MAIELWAMIVAAIASAVLPALIFVVIFAWPGGQTDAAIYKPPTAEQAAAAQAASEGRRRRAAARAAACPTCVMAGTHVPFELVERMLALVDEPATRWYAAAVCRCWREACKGGVAVVSAREPLRARGGELALARVLRAREATGLELVGSARAIEAGPLRALVFGPLRPPLLTSVSLAHVLAASDASLAAADDGGGDGVDDDRGGYDDECRFYGSDEDGDASDGTPREPPRAPLESLDLSDTLAGDGALRALVGRAGNGHALRCLRLARCARLSEHGLSALAESCSALRELSLRFCAGLPACVALAPLLQRNGGSLESLDLSGLPLTDSQCAVLAQACAQLVELKLFGCAQLSADGAAALLLLPRLRALDLGNCAQLAAVAKGEAASADAAARAARLLARIAPPPPTAAGEEGSNVVRAPVASPLRCLGLFRVGSDELLAALAAGPLAATLADLDLRGCMRATERGVESLRGLRALRALELQASSLSSKAGLALLAAALPGCELRFGRAGQRGCVVASSAESTCGAAERPCADAQTRSATIS